MVYYKTDHEISIIKQNGILLGKTHAEVAKLVKPGITTSTLNKIAEEYIADHQAHPSFKGYVVGSKKFPSALCISVNDVVVHGLPSEYTLVDGDIVSIDCGVYLNGFHADSAYTYAVGEISEEVGALLKTTKESLYLAIKNAVDGKRVGDVSFEVQNYCESKGYTIVRELVGHGVGRNLHEDPEVPNYGKRGTGPKLKEGMVMAIEPMVNLGSKYVKHGNDGWTIKTKDGRPSAHFEHTVAIR
ncbi:MAG: type I methionyl aminopeptidase, partial [Bacteroidota bacterium]